MINLLPEKEKNELKKQENWQKFFIILLFFAFSLLFLSFLFWGLAYHARSKAAILKSELIQLEEGISSSEFREFQEETIKINQNLVKINGYFENQVFISPVFEMAGAEKNVINIVKHLDKNKYEAAVIAGRAQEELKNKLDNRSKLIILGNSNSIFLFFAVIRHLRREKPDILFSGLPHINLISTAAKIFSRSGAKLILVEHTNFLSLAGTAKTPGKRFLAHFILPFLIRFFYPKADAIICVSNGVAKDLLAVAPRLSKIEVIYNPVVDELMSKLALEQVQHPWFSNSKIPIIVSVGRLVKAKDYPNLLKAFKIVLSSLNCRLVVIGQGEQKSFLEELGRRLGVGDKVAFLGFQENPYKYMARASVFVLSSAREGFGNAIVEAMALGLPVVATSSAGPSEIIENNKNGLLVPVGNEKSLAAAIFKILRDPILAGKFAEQGKKRAQDFTIEKSVQKYEEVFKKLIQCKPAS